MSTLTRKIELYVVGDKKEVSRVYDYIRLAMDATYKCYNECMTALYIAKVKDDTTEERKELNRLYSRQTYTKNETAFTKDIVFPKGLALASYVNHLAQQKFATSLANGLMHGCVSLPTFKKDCAIPLRVEFVSLAGKDGKGKGFYHEYADVNDLVNALEFDNNPKVFLRFPEKTNITFGVVFGNPRKAREQRSVFSKIFLGEYKINGSSIQINSKGKIILNLTMQVPDIKTEHIEGRIVGVDLGQKIPAMCAMNDDNYSRNAIGDIENFLKVRTQIQNQRRRLQKNLRNTSSGHGRKKKLKPLDRISEKERNFVSTYNHMVSKRVVDYAVKNCASQINIEDLSGFAKDKNGESVEDERKKKVLRNWSYFELQQQIRYKAERYGIKVRTVNPAYTSQICSYCGEMGVRPKQEKFICSNPDCSCHKIYKDGWINADFNAARNIAMSTDYTDDEEGKKKKKKSSKKKSEKNAVKED